MKSQVRKPDILFPELSYRIVGILIKVFKELGSDLLEKHYQRAIAIEFSKAGIAFKEQFPVNLFYDDKKIGTYFLDFLVEEVVILEIKKSKNFFSKNIKQVLNYLKALKLQLGILANFTENGVVYKRIVNIK